MRKFILVSLTALTTLLGALLFAPPSQQSCNDIFNGVQHSPCSVSNAHSLVTWRDWLQGKSRSTQFHFLDLVELMFGDKVTESAKQKVTSEKKSFLMFSYE